MPYFAGARVHEIFRQLNDTGTDDDYDIAKAKLKEHFKAQKNHRYEVFKSEARNERNARQVPHLFTILSTDMLFR